ncbi:MAG: hypothetical protein ACREQX_11815 [Candidatus Binataceae bacterium]
MRLYKRNRLIWAGENLFVDSGLPALANLIAGITTGQFVSAIGFGSGSTPPASTDTTLGATPAYYSAVGSHTFPSSGSVQFDYALQVADYAANGMTIQELGLFANSGGVSLPAATGAAFPAWSANASEPVGSMVLDGNGNVQRCVTAGTTSSSAPAWNTAPGGTSGDGSVVWMMAATHVAPGPMIAHVTVPAFAYNGTGNYAGNWTLTF